MYSVTNEPIQSSSWRVSSFKDSSTLGNNWVVNFTKAIWHQQQQPVVITRCFMGFNQSSDDYTILFCLKSVTD